MNNIPAIKTSQIELGPRVPTFIESINEDMDTNFELHLDKDKNHDPSVMELYLRKHSPFANFFIDHIKSLPAFIIGNKTLYFTFRARIAIKGTSRTILNSWHYDGCNTKKFIGYIASIGSSPTEFLIGPVHNQSRNQVYFDPDRDRAEKECKLVSHKNRIVKFNSNSFHRTPQHWKKSEMRYFMRCFIDDKYK